MRLNEKVDGGGQMTMTSWPHLLRINFEKYMDFLDFVKRFIIHTSVDNEPKTGVKASRFDALLKQNLEWVRPCPHG